jgi:hypothetical protein
MSWPIASWVGETDDYRAPGFGEHVDLGTEQSGGARGAEQRLGHLRVHGHEARDVENGDGGTQPAGAGERG